MVDPIQSGNIFANAEFLQFRDVFLPVMDWEHRFSHASAQHHIIYRDGVAVDQLGGQARTFSYRLAFYNGIERAPFYDAFRKLYFDFYEAYRDKEAGDLIDPIHGPIWAVPGEWNGSTDVTHLDGVEVRVTFTEDVPTDATTEERIPTFSSLEQAATGLDEAAKVVPWKRPDLIPNLTDPVSAVTGVVQQANRQKQRMQSAFMVVADKAGELERASEELGTDGGPKTNAVRMAARDLRLRSTKAATSPPDELVKQSTEIVTTAPKLVAQVAAAAGMDVLTFLRLNRNIVRNGTIPAGSKIRIIPGKRRRR